MLIKVISGGQTGVDQAGLSAARYAGLETGGYAPEGFKTLDGPNLDLRDVYHLTEMPNSGYAIRTRKNVECSDGTIRIAKYWGSPGERCTVNALNSFKRPQCDLSVYDITENMEYSLRTALEFFTTHNIEVLNVAGNSEKTCPGIYTFSESFLKFLFMMLKKSV